MALLDFQPVLGRHNLRPPHFASKVSYSAAPHEIRCYVVPYKKSGRSPFGGRPGFVMVCGLVMVNLVLHSNQEIVFLSALHNEEFTADEIFGRQFLVEGSEFFFVDADTAALRELAHFALRGKAFGGFCQEVDRLSADSLVA